MVTPGKAPDGASDETTVLRPVRDEERGRERSAADRAPRESDSEVTTKLPQPPVPPGADETAVLPPVVPGAADETAVLPPVVPGAADETTVLPPVPPGAADETAVLPPVSGEPADRVPPGLSRNDERTREMPQVDETGAPRQRARSDWAEETPLDDLPTLADELLGPHEDEYDDEGGRGRGRRR
ncbi:putative Thymidylate kinase [Streptomyces viridochromogenes Tue57]|uniref:Putative Thymidylate kinase n=1 Tax=Streptomyces viridochromogenes Tue57 TaxID=1160705 RepID=L8PGS4_STRVR|nr:putative Thymidylate kinase [Streptomyces viridochromogenes Tue57]